MSDKNSTPRIFNTDKKVILKKEEIIKRRDSHAKAEQIFNQEIQELLSFSPEEIAEAREIKRKLSQLERYDKLQSKVQARDIATLNRQEIEIGLADMESKGITEVETYG